MVSISYGHGNLYDFGSNFLFEGSTVYTATGDGAGGSEDIHTDAAALTQANDYWNGCYIKVLSATNDIVGEIREITDFIAADDRLVHDAFSDNSLTGDTFLLSKWNIIEDGQTLATPACVEGDYLDLEATASAGNKKAYITTEGTNHDRTAIGVSTTTYTKIRYRYSCAGTAKGRIVAVFSTYDYGETEATNITNEKAQLILDDTTSATMTSAVVTLTTAKTLNHLRFYCNNTDDHVYYDFALVYAGDFTFPNGAYGINGTIPNRNIHLDIPSRQSTITQQLGSGDFTINIGCDLTNGDWTRTGDNIDGEVFYDILHNAPDEPWQWLDTEREQMKVTLDPVTFTRGASGTMLTDRMNLTFREYRGSSADNSYETYATRWGTDL